MGQKRQQIYNTFSILILGGFIMATYNAHYDEFGYEREDYDGTVQLNEYLTPKEVMELLDIGKNTFYKMVQSGELPAFRVGKQWRVRKADILKLY